MRDAAAEGLTRVRVVVGPKVSAPMLRSRLRIVNGPDSTLGGCDRQRRTGAQRQADFISGRGVQVFDNKINRKALCGMVSIGTMATSASGSMIRPLRPVQSQLQAWLFAVL